MHFKWNGGVAHLIGCFNYDVKAVALPLLGVGLITTITVHMENLVCVRKRLCASTSAGMRVSSGCGASRETLHLETTP